jgi:hypothetical protein
MIFLYKGFLLINPWRATMLAKTSIAGCALLVCAYVSPSNATECEDTIIISGPPVGCSHDNGTIIEIDLSQCKFSTKPFVTVSQQVSGDQDSISAYVLSSNTTSAKISVTVGGVHPFHICNPSSITWKAHD